MLIVLITWCCLAAAAFLAGFAVLAPIQKKSGYQVQAVTSYMMAGLLVLNVYAQYYSLFAGVDLWAMVPVAGFALAAAVLLRRKIGAFLRKKMAACGWGRRILWVCLLLLFAYGSSRGYMHYDTGLYHAQSIRWIESYGVVPGLANLHSRFGYNSAAFALTALFGGGGVTKYPLHCVPGFFALLCAGKCMALLELPKKRRVQLSDFLYLGCLFYLVAVFRELVAPASDYFAMLILFFVAMCWVELLERRETATLPYGLLALYLVYAATVKLSTAVLLVLALYPGIRLLRQKKWGQIAAYLGVGFGIAFPYLARNVLISGWLFYPFTFFDIFPVDWKISRGYADYDALEIQAYAKEIFDVRLKDMPFREWFPHWLSAQTGLDRLLVLAGWTAVPVGAVSAAVNAFRAGKAAAVWKKSEAAADACCQGHKSAGKKSAKAEEKTMAGISCAAFALLQTAAILGFFFWQFGAPLVRYGYFYVLFLPLVTFGALYTAFWEKGRGFVIFSTILVAFLCYRGYNLSQMVLEFAGEPYYLWQQDYGTYPAETYEVDGVTIYVPTDRGQIGYDQFPSSPVRQNIELRDGRTLESGFRQKG